MKKIIIVMAAVFFAVSCGESAGKTEAVKAAEKTAGKYMKLMYLSRDARQAYGMYEASIKAMFRPADLEKKILEKEAEFGKTESIEALGYTLPAGQKTASVFFEAKNSKKTSYHKVILVGGKYTGFRVAAGDTSPVKFKEMDEGMEAFKISAPVK